MRKRRSKRDIEEEEEGSGRGVGPRERVGKGRGVYITFQFGSVRPSCEKRETSTLPWTNASRRNSRREACEFSFLPLPPHPSLFLTCSYSFMNVTNGVQKSAELVVAVCIFSTLYAFFKFDFIDLFFVALFLQLSIFPFQLLDYIWCWANMVKKNTLIRRF